MNNINNINNMNNMNIKLRVIIMAAGIMSRWNNYLDIPKHLINIEGEKILHRTIRLVKKYISINDDIDIDIDIKVISRIKEGYENPNATLVLRNFNENDIPPASMTSCEYFIKDKNSINLVLYGDVYFSDDAIKMTNNEIIKNYNKENNTFNKKIVFLGREGPNLNSGCSYGELFGFLVTGNQANKLIAAIETVRIYKNKKLIPRFTTWEVYRYLVDIPLIDHIVRKDEYDNIIFLEICDWTEDFDTQTDYDNWIYNREIYLFLHNQDSFISKKS
jgi:hypothetical protein